MTRRKPKPRTLAPLIAGIGDAGMRIPLITITLFIMLEEGTADSMTELLPLTVEQVSCLLGVRQAFGDREGLTFAQALALQLCGE
jgi:hypothetical protein